MNKKQLIGFAIGPVLGALVGIITLPLTAWIFPPEDIGRIAILQVFVGLVVLVMSLGLDQSYVREYHEVNDKEKLFAMGVIPPLLVYIIVTASIMWIDPSYLSVALFEINNPTYSFLIVLALGATLLTRFFSLVLRMQGKGLAFSMCQVLPKVLLLATLAFYLFIDITGEFEYLLFAHVITVTCVFAIFFWNIRTTIVGAIKSKLDSERLKDMMRFGLPLILGGLAYWGLTSSDKIILKELSSLEEVALYSISVSFASAAIILQKVFTIVWSPIVYKWVKENKDLHRVKEVTDSIQCLVVIIFLLTGVLSPLVPLLLPDEYGLAQSLVLACMSFPLFYTLSETTVVGISVARKTLYSMCISLVCFGINILGNFLLIPELGATGAAFSTVISFFVYIILRTYLSDRIWYSFKRKEFYFINASLVIVSLVHLFYAVEYSMQLTILYIFGLVAFIYAKKSLLKGMYLFLVKDKS